MEEEPRAALERLILESGEDFAGLSKLVGRNPAYIQQFIKRGTPKKLPETERGILARYFGVDEVLLGKSSDAAVTSGIRLIPKLAVGASAGAGAIHDGEALAGKIGFDEKWLRRMGLDPAKLSLIRLTVNRCHPRLIMVTISWSITARRPKRCVMASTLSGWTIC